MWMNIDITKLHSGIEKVILINETYSFSKEELENTEIIQLDDVKINGEITKNSIGEYNININVKGTMILPCSISLKPVNYDFAIDIEGNLQKMYEELGENYENNQKTIDILPIIWENILMEIPIKVTSNDLNDIKTKGDGWELVTDEK